MKLLFGITLLTLTASALAEPYMSVRTGMKCSQCHLNQSGGAGRTEYGHAYTQYKLVMEQTQRILRERHDEELTSFNPRLNESVTIGGNFRTENFTSLGYRKSTDTATFRADGENQPVVSEANLYINVELVKNFLSMYIDQTMSTGSNREFWMMARNLPLNSYIKVGRTLLPYGMRIMDDQAFIRSQTNFTYGRTDLAAEIGFEPGPLSVIANLTNDHFSTVGYFNHRRFRVGGSYATSTRDGVRAIESVYGPFMGFNFGRFTTLHEMDFINRASGDSTILQIANFHEVNFVPMQGVNLKTTYEYFDRNTKIANRRDGQERWTFGAEAFPIQFLQLGLYYRLNRFIPQAAEANRDVIIGINDAAVTNATELRRRMTNVPRGEPIRFEVLRERRARGVRGTAGSANRVAA
jgi:hypothetical protein